jgi:toxin ParE1/3/4
MRVRWTPTAAADLQNIYDYLKEHEPHLTQPTVIEIRKSARSLCPFIKKVPPRARQARDEGTRELLQRRLPHIIAYRVKDDAVEILHIWHPARNPAHRQRIVGLSGRLFRPASY